MKQLPAFVLILTGLLASTACQQITPKPGNVSVEPGSMTSTTAGAVGENPAASPLDPVVQYLKEQLSLTEQQANKVNQVFKDSSIQREAINAQRRTLAGQMVELQKKKLERINAVLTPKQARKYQQMRDEPLSEVIAEQPSLEPPQNDPVVELKKQLKLTKQQTNKVNEIFKDTSAQQEALNAQRANLRNQVRELQRKKQEQINAVLTQEQAKKYEQIRSEPPPEVMKAHPAMTPQPTE